MSSTDTLRSQKTDLAPTRDRDWKAQRDIAPHLAAGSSSAPEPGASSGGSGSLRSRISDKEGPRSLVPAPANSYRPDPLHKDDDRDNSRKRTVSGGHRNFVCLFSVDHVMIIIDREKDASDSASGPGAEQTAQPPKRPRINRNRYQSSSYAIAKKLLPTDSQAGDKTRSGRKD
jgi:THO complex subunit 2